MNNNEFSFSNSFSKKLEFQKTKQQEEAQEDG